ncbi:MAG: hypothetical protein ACOYOK_01510 [Pseudobdellovibrionaceae bacterium]
MKAIFIFLAFIAAQFFSESYAAAPVALNNKSSGKSAIAHTNTKNKQCQALQAELKAMQNAQEQIMHSLVNNHDLFAQQLEKYAMAVQLSPRMGSAAHKTLVGNMQSSAEAFKLRAEKGEKMTDKFTTASADLLQRVLECLK